MSGTKHPVSDSTLQALWYLPWNNRSEQLHQDSFHWSLRETTSSLSSLSLLKHVIICNKLQLLSQFYWFIVLGWDWKHFYHLVFAIIFAPGYGTCDDVKRLLNHLYELAVPRSSTLSGPHVGLAFHFWFLLLFVTAPCADPLSEKLNAGKVGIFFCCKSCFVQKLGEAAVFYGFCIPLHLPLVVWIRCLLGVSVMISICKNKKKLRILATNPKRRWFSCVLMFE